MPLTIAGLCLIKTKCYVGRMRRFLGPVALVSILTACGSDPPPAPVTPVQPPPAVAPVAVVTPPEPAKPLEPTPEEKKKAADQKELKDDRAKMEVDTKAELARWTPEMHAAAKAIAEKSYPSGKAAIQAAMAAKCRKPDDAARDKYRHPAETLDAFGFKPNMTVLEYGPGEGWYTELLAPALAKNGKLLVSSGDPNGPIDIRSTLYAQRTKALLASSPELYGKVETVVVDPKAPKLGADASVDMVLLMRELHGMNNNHTLAAWLAEFHRVLKPGGVLGVEQHRAKADANPDVSSKNGYLPEKWCIEQIEAAGFKLAGHSEINANPKDTKDYAEGVWTLPPSFTLKEKDHDKYAAIGESDRMTLKFVKVIPKAPVAPKTAPPAPPKK
jgi:predicted methyltransferase